MQNRPTPRDLFNPPPQARVERNTCYLEEIREAIEELYVYDTHRRVLHCIVETLADHEALLLGGERP
jgi:hypothetical protein